MSTHRRSPRANPWLLLLAMVPPMLGGCQMAHAPRPGPSTTGVLFDAATVHGRAHNIAIYAPRDYTPDREWPAIVFLNGRGECGNDGQRQLAVGLLPAILAEPEEWPFVVVFPQKPDQASAWSDHEELVLASLERAREGFRIDPRRVYLTGLSQGGCGTWLIGARHPEVFAALAPVCGYGEPEELGAGARGLAIWAFHGEADDVVKPAQTRALVARAEQLGARVRATYYPGVNHNAWDRAYRDEALGAWFLEHPMGVRPASSGGE